MQRRNILKLLPNLGVPMTLLCVDKAHYFLKKKRELKIPNISLEFSNTSKKGATVQKWSQIKANLVHSSVLH